jgi:baseplate J-like protein
VSYVAEPYVQFVDDLLTALTGGETRRRFVYLAAQADYPLASSAPLIPGTLRVFGQAQGAFRLFAPGRDFKLQGGAVHWLDDAGAVAPDEGTPFYANFEVQRPAGSAPLLTDRHPGSVTRLLAESFAREYAVLSGQLEAVYRAGFLDTATGRDLDEMVKLVGLTRRSAAFAVGSAVFSRLSPAPADVAIEAGTRLSTVQPPAVSFVTTEERTLRRGELTVDAPIAATAAGAAGVVAAGAVGAIDRPILGVDGVTNPLATRLTGAEEDDEALRQRARHALEGAGLATPGALLAALTSLPELREKDIRIVQYHLAFPGVVKLGIVLPTARAMTPAECTGLNARVQERIDETRPVGVRVLHRLDVVRPPDTPPPPAPGVVISAPAVVSGPAQPLPVQVNLKVVPASPSLTPAERTDLERRARQAVEACFAGLGVGETLVYNRLIAGLMAIDGVLDVAVDLGAASLPSPVRANLYPADPGLRPVLKSLTVAIAGQLVLLSVAVTITPQLAGKLGDPQSDLQAALEDVADRLQNGLRTLASSKLDQGALQAILADPASQSVSRRDIPDFLAGLLNQPVTRQALQRMLSETSHQPVTPEVLQGFVASPPNYTATIDSYQVEYVDAGVRVKKLNVEIPLTGDETLWIGRVALTGGAGA